MPFRTLELILRARDGDLSRVLLSSAGQIKAWEKTAESAGKTSERSGKKMQDAAKAGVVAFGSAFVLAETQAMKFDATMRDVNSISGRTEEGFRTLSTAVLDLAKSGQITQGPQVLAEGLYDVASSGFQGAEGLQIVKTAAIAATAGLTSTAVAAKGITAVLNAYGRDASDAADVSDVLFSTVDYGVISFEELTGSIGDVVGQAAAAKVGIEQVGSAIATMTLTGITGSESITSLNRLIEKIVKPSKNLAALYEQLGYASGSAALAQKGLRGVMEDIRVATGGNIDALLNLFPEIRAARGALALMANEGRNYARVAEQIEVADHRRGATTRTLNEQMKAASNQLRALWAQTQAVMIEGATKTMPAVVALVGKAREAGQAAGDVVRRIIEALGPTWEALSNIGHDLGKVWHDLDEEFRPILSWAVHLAGSGLADVLNAVGSAAADLTGLLADNRDLVIALSVVMAGRFVASAVAAAGGLKYLLNLKVLTPLVLGFDTAMRKAGSSQAAFAVSSVAAGAAVTLLVTGLVKEINRFRDAGKDTAKGIDEVFANLTGDGGPTWSRLVEAQKQLDGLKAKVDQARKEVGKKEKHGLLYQVFFGPDDAPTPRKDIDKWLKDRNIDASTGELEKAQRRLDTLTKNTTENTQLLANAYGLTDTQVENLARELDVDLSGSIIAANTKFADHAAAAADTSATEEKLVTAMGALADSADSAGDRVKALKEALDGLMGGQLGVNEATRNWIGGLKDLSEQLGKAHGNLNLNTEAGRANSAALDGQARALADLVVAQANNGASSAQLQKTWDGGVAALRRTMTQAGFSKRQIDEYTKSLGLVPGNVETIIAAAGASRSAQDVQRLRDQIDALHDKHVSVTTDFFYRGQNVGSAAKAPGDGRLMNAYGNVILSYADGGIQKLPKDALIRRAGPALVQWAEPGTGGEAFIPLGADRRGRSEQILATVADMFGMVLLPNPRQAAPRPAAPFVSALTPAPAFGDQTMTSVSSVLSGVAGGKPASFDQYLKALQVSAIQTAQWRKNLAKIAAGAGQDVADQLAAMGESAADLVAKMAAGTAAQMKQMAAALKGIGPAARTAMQQFADSLRVDNSTQKQFQDDLTMLVSLGQATLASQLAQMGAEQGAAIAHEAVNAQAGDLATLGRLASEKAAAAQSGEGLSDALMLAGILMNSDGPLGIVGLSERAKMSVGDVLGLVTRFRSDVFSKIPYANTSALWADQRLIDRGMPPTGLMAGGIVTDAATRAGALYYRWAEPGSGGESLIPHGPQYRARALRLWGETGRMLGVRDDRPAAGRTVVLGSGAVQVNVRVDGSTLSARDVEQVAVRAATRAQDSLVHRLRQRGM